MKYKTQILLTGMYFKYKYKYFEKYLNTSLYYPRTSPLFAFTCNQLIITNYLLHLIKHKFFKCFVTDSVLVGVNRSYT